MDYMHEWQRPTLGGIYKQGCANIDSIIDRLCSQVETPKIELMGEQYHSTTPLMESLLRGGSKSRALSEQEIAQRQLDAYRSHQHMMEKVNQWAAEQSRTCAQTYQHGGLTAGALGGAFGGLF